MFDLLIGEGLSLPVLAQVRIHLSKVEEFNADEITWFHI